MKERHSITNLSDTPSDFLRVELKSIPPTAIKQVFRGDEPKEPYHPSVETLYKIPSLRVDHILCALPAPCVVPIESAPSVLVTIPLYETGSPSPSANPTTWLPAHTDLTINIDPKARGPFEVLRILLPKP